MITQLITHAVGSVQPAKDMMDPTILALNAQFLRLSFIFKAENVCITVHNYQLLVQMHHVHHVL